MKKFLLILGGVILSLSASAIGEASVKHLYVVAEAHPTGAGTVYLHAKNKAGNADAERQYVYDRTGGRGSSPTWNADQGWEEKAELWYCPGENGSMKGVDCTGTNPIYEAVMMAQPNDGWELVCYANQIKESGIYTPEDCYALIHGDSGDPRECDFDYTGEEYHNDNTGEHWINANNNLAAHNDKDGSSQSDVFNAITGLWYTPVDAQVYAIFRRVGEELPRFVKDAIYFVDMAGWNEVKAYAWNQSASGTEVVSSDWPGDDMSDAGITNIYDQEMPTYKISLPNTPQFVIFNNNDQGEQTGDMTYISGATYAYDGYTATSKLMFIDGDEEFQIPAETAIQEMNMCYPRYFEADRKTTVCLPFALSADAAAAAGKFYKIISYTNGTLVFDKLEGAIPANTPVVFESAIDGYPFEDIFVETLPATELQELVGDDGSRLLSTLKKEDIYRGDENPETTYFYFDDEAGEWKVQYNIFGYNYVTPTPYHAVVGVPTDNVPATGMDNGSVVPAVYDGQGSTGIKSVENAESVNNGAVYDLNGRRVSPSSKGVRIVEGKKYIQK